MGKKKDAVAMPTDAGLLEELASLDTVEARIPTARDHDAGAVPPWCELTLHAQRLAGKGPGTHPINVTWPLRRHDGELIIQVLHDTLHPDSSTSAINQLWAALDEVVIKVQKRAAKGKEPRPLDVGEARGLVTALAVMTNPFSPDVDAIRETAMERFEAHD